MKRTLIQVLFSILILGVLLIQPVRTVRADWVANTVPEFVTNISNAVQGTLDSHGSNVSVMHDNFLTLACMILGCTDDDENPFSYNRSAVSGFAYAIEGIYANPPASTYAFVVDTGKTLGFLPKVHAQGVGFSGLSALLDLWKVFRNIAYALLSVVLIFIGFMVMFRKKIDPKTVVTVQNALPRIVVALLLITFSYAIVGFMIDLMYLAIMLIASLITGAYGDMGWLVEKLGKSPKDIVLSGSVGDLFTFFFAAGFDVLDNVYALFSKSGDAAGVFTTTTIITGLIGLFTGKLKGALVGALSLPVILIVIVGVILLFGFIRLIFMLLDAYLNIIISLLIAPLQLMTAAIPGSNAFGSWFNHLLSKIIVFPITAALMLVGAVLTSASNGEGLWAPPLLSSTGQPHGIAGFIGLGMLLIIPTVVAGLQKAMKAEPVIPGGVGTIFGPMASAAGQIGQMAYYSTFISSSFRHKPDTRSPYQQLAEGSQKGLGGLTGGGGGH